MPTTRKKNDSRKVLVKRLQRALMDAGLGSELGANPVDGNYGLGTERAVKKFQRSHGLPETGLADPSTLELLGLDPTTVMPAIDPDDIVIDDSDPTATKFAVEQFVDQLADFQQAYATQLEKAAQSFVGYLLSSSKTETQNRMLEVYVDSIVEEFGPGLLKKLPVVGDAVDVAMGVKKAYDAAMSEDARAAAARQRMDVKNFAEMHGHLARTVEARIDKVEWSEALHAAVAQSSDPNAYRESLKAHARAMSDSRSWLIDLLFHKFLLETAELWIKLGSRQDMLDPAGCVDVVFDTDETPWSVKAIKINAEKPDHVLGVLERIFRWQMNNPSHLIRPGMLRRPNVMNLAVPKRVGLGSVATSFLPENPSLIGALTSVGPFIEKWAQSSAARASWSNHGAWVDASGKVVEWPAADASMKKLSKLVGPSRRWPGLSVAM
ncbi:MAG: peptidoglycan-binding domain-containing protein [Phycisphaerae bacterium]|nr:peptidoglycan-binding domain-containing protein [Phycisphaerae bacterium]